MRRTLAILALAVAGIAALRYVTRETARKERERHRTAVQQRLRQRVEDEDA